MHHGTGCLVVPLNKCLPLGPFDLFYLPHNFLSIEMGLGSHVFVPAVLLFVLSASTELMLGDHYFSAPSTLLLLLSINKVMVYWSHNCHLT